MARFESYHKNFLDFCLHNCSICVASRCLAHSKNSVSRVRFRRRVARDDRESSLCFMPWFFLEAGGYTYKATSAKKTC